MSNASNSGAFYQGTPEIEALPAQTGFYRVSGLPGFEPLPGVTMHLMAGARAMVNWVRIEAGKEVPLHAHPHEQAGLVLEGAIIMTIAGETRRCEPGDCYVIAGGVEHAGLAGEVGCLVLDIFSPPREAYLAAARG